MRGHRVRPRGPHCSERALLERGRRAKDSGDVRVELLHVSSGDRSVPRGAAHAEACCCRARDEAVVATREVVDDGELHIITGYVGDGQPARSGALVAFWGCFISASETKQPQKRC